MIQVDGWTMGSGGVVQITGDSELEVKEEAAKRKAAIDFMRSPHVTGPYEGDDGRWVSQIRYWGLD